jgi:hypothetical protein
LEKYATSVIDTGGAQVIPLAKFAASVLNTDGKFATGVIDTGGAP